MKPHCIIAGNTVTASCEVEAGKNMMCDIGKGTMIIAIADNHKSISGTLTTTITVMANWSKEMWEGVSNRAVPMMASSPFGSHFFLAVGTVNLKAKLTVKSLK
ncbi:hypothetical protein KIN20_018691 [Parelaphostrongylus tenuis]|uniref:Uncharacterized protein n=1 Tax=Parelaphostrongylus tenuis TaxID=148309 RepID=A0AAD5MNE4_PARTN|nr:hypothetical protein KIN20_018691 [Parelaphostrongylus tenuis]